MLCQIYSVLTLQLIASFILVEAIIFDGESSLHVWLTVSSLINKDASDHRALIFRQIELNWINAPLDHDSDHIGLYLDSEPGQRGSMPVSVHKLSGQTSGHIITDFFLPQIDFFNETTNPNEDLDPTQQSNSQSTRRWNEYAPVGGATFANRRQHQEKPTVLANGSQCLGYCLAYHSQNKILASNCLRTNPSWMADSFQYISSRSLPNLMLPGSHNSATYPKLLDKSALNMINKYQMNQDEPIFNQLVHGIRHLDLRVGYAKVKQRPERLWIYHDIFRTDVSVEEVLDQVRKFLDLTSHEVIIMDFHRFTVGFQNENQPTQRERHAKLVELIFKKLGHYIVPSYLGQHAPLHELVSAGKRLVVGYAARSMILGSNELSILGQLSAAAAANDKTKTPKQQIQDIDAIKQEQEDYSSPSNRSVPSTKLRTDHQSASERRLIVGSGLFNKLKSLKVINRVLRKKRSLTSSPNRFLLFSPHQPQEPAQGRRVALNELDVSDVSSHGVESESQSLAKVALFFAPVRHLWPDKDSLEGLAQYMNNTTCRKYFGELRSMMVELTPTVFGAISDKYDGNRRLAQQVNRPVTDWIRDRWLHCINIVASDYFLGNDLIQLSIYANRMRAHQTTRSSLGSASNHLRCESFRKIGHRLDRSRIPVQFTFHQPVATESTSSSSGGDQESEDLSFVKMMRPTAADQDNDLIAHTSSDGNRIFLRPVHKQAGKQSTASGERDKRDSFVDNFSDGFSNLFSSFKRLLNL